jgi:hypothetical protein
MPQALFFSLLGGFYERDLMLGACPYGALGQRAFSQHKGFDLCD